VGFFAILARFEGDAGLTHGGFYSHFASKEALIEEVVEAGMEETFERVVESAREGGIEAFIRFYLRPSRREQLRRIVSHIASLLPTPNVEVAQAIFAMLVGTLQLAGAVSDPALSDQLLKAGQDAALLLAKYKS